MALSGDIINQIVPRSSLQDLSQSKSDIDNDIDYLLNWLSPYFPTAHAANCKHWRTFQPQKPAEPTQRLRSAVRSCLKNHQNQTEFVKLYINSVNSEFDRFFTTNDFSDFEFLDFFALIRIIVDYYNDALAVLNLDTFAKGLLKRNLNGLLHTHLVGTFHEQSESSFITKLKEYLNDQVVEKATFLDENLVSPAGNSSNSLVDIINTLFSVNLHKEVSYILVRLSVQKIQRFIATNCTGVWHVPLLEMISEFIKNQVYRNFSIVLSSSSDDLKSNAYLYEFIKISNDELVSLRIKEIFGLVLNYPHSKIALEELHQCLSIKYNHHHYNDTTYQETYQKTFDDVSSEGHHNHTQDHSHYGNLINVVTNLTSFSNLANYSLKTQSYQRKKLVDTYIDICHNRLLHSGSNTNDVITTYTKTINSFLIIDPKGVLLDKVVRPIRRYLKTREDIVIKLVHGLLDKDDVSKLGIAQHLRASQLKKHKQVRAHEDLELNWVPDPIDALPDFKKDKVSDIIESLISIFDSKTIFIDEFTKLIGEKLIQVHDYNVNEINEQLDLLKSIFGKSEFTMLDIMIRDIVESRTINDLIRPRLNHTQPLFHSSILSHLYWDNLEQTELQVPDTIRNIHDQYNQQFSKLKRGRSLKLVPNLGLVTLNLRFKSRVFNFQVSPELASIISLFDDEENELSLDYVSNKLGISPYNAGKGLSFWVKQNILVELTKTLFIVNDDDDIEELAPTTSQITSIPSSTSTVQPTTPTHPLAVLWPHLNTILENITSLSFERIKNLLKLTVPKEKYDVSQVSDEAMVDLLDWLVEKKKIILSAGTYKLNRQ